MNRRSWSRRPLTRIDKIAQHGGRGIETDRSDLRRPTMLDLINVIAVVVVADVVVVACVCEMYCCWLMNGDIRRLAKSETYMEFGDNYVCAYAGGRCETKFTSSSIVPVCATAGLVEQ